MFFPRGTPKPGWVAQRRQPGCKLDVQSVQCLPGSRRRFRQLGGQKTLNKIVLLRSNPNRQRAFKAAYPLRSRPHSCRGKLDWAVLQKLLEHEPEKFHARSQSHVVCEGSHFTSFYLPNTITFGNMNRTMSFLETDEELVKRYPLQRRVGSTDVGNPIGDTTEQVQTKEPTERRASKRQLVRHDQIQLRLGRATRSGRETCGTAGRSREAVSFQNFETAKMCARVREACSLQSSSWSEKADHKDHTEAGRAACAVLATPSAISLPQTSQRSRSLSHAVGLRNMGRHLQDFDTAGTKSERKLLDGSQQVAVLGVGTNR